MRRTIRLFLLLEGASFALAGLVHAGALVGGYAHQQASIAESTIAGVLLVGFGLTWVWPAATRPIGLAAQGIALLGTLVGAFTIAVGVGPRTVPDVVYHAAILVALAWGLVVAARGRAHEDRAHRRRRADPRDRAGQARARPGWPWPPGRGCRRRWPGGTGRLSRTTAELANGGTP